MIMYTKNIYSEVLNAFQKGAIDNYECIKLSIAIHKYKKKYFKEQKLMYSVKKSEQNLSQV